MRITYDLISAYFADVFYNHIYTACRAKLKDKDASALTDVYARQVYLFALEHKTSRETMARTIRDLYQYFNNHVNSKLHNIATFIAMVVGQFVPAEVSSRFTDTERNDLFNHIIEHVMSTSATTISSPATLQKIIATRGKKEAAAVIKDLQSTLYSNLEFKRQELVSKFMTTGLKHNTPMVPAEHIQQLIARVTELEAALVSARNDSSGEVVRLRAENEKLRAQLSASIPRVDSARDHFASSAITTWESDDEIPDNPFEEDDDEEEAPVDEAPSTRGVRAEDLRPKSREPPAEEHASAQEPEDDNIFFLP